LTRFAVRFSAIGTAEKLRIAKITKGGKSPGGAQKARRKVYFESSGFVDTPIYERQKLLAGNELYGSAIVEEPASTTIVHPGQKLTADLFGNLIIEAAES
jgi:N-methylhydantoinase A